MVYSSSSLSHDLAINQKPHICDTLVYSKSETLYADYIEIDFRVRLAFPCGG
jgi:hypothetical protein